MQTHTRRHAHTHARAHTRTHLLLEFCELFLQQTGARGCAAVFALQPRHFVLQILNLCSDQQRGGDVFVDGGGGIRKERE